MTPSRLRSASVAVALAALVPACGFSGLPTGPAEDTSPTEPPPGPGGPAAAPPPASGDPAPGGSSGSPSVPITSCSDYVLSFDGVDDFASVPDDTQLDLSGDFTVEAWIKPGPKVATGAEMHLVSHHDWPDSRGWVLLLDQGHVEIHVYGDENFSSKGYAAGNAAGPAYVVAGKWAHVAGTRRGNILRVYYDGVLRDTQQLGTFFSRSNYYGRLTFGRAAWTDDYRYEGELDDVRLSNNARYTADTAPKPTAALPVDAATIAAWRFDETSGTTLTDAVTKHDGSFAAGATAPGRVASTCIDAR